MATIESLDLATLTNNPQSIAEALEDVLEVTSTNIGTLKTEAQTKKDAIDTLLTQATADAQAIANALSALNIENYHSSTMLNGWTAWDIANIAADEGGITIYKMSDMYVCHLAIYKNTSTVQDTQTVISLSGDITLPTNHIDMGRAQYGDSGNADNTAKVILNNNGDLKVQFNNVLGDFMHIIGNFIGFDV